MVDCLVLARQFPCAGCAANAMDKKKLTYPWFNGWTLLAILIFLLVAIPAFTLIVRIFDSPGPQWPYIAGRLLSHYVPSTLLVLGGVSVLTLFIGVGMAWLVSTYQFPGRRFFEWALILPLAFPAYMMGYSYVGLLEYTGPVNTFLRNKLGIDITGPIFDIMNIWGAVFVLSMSLYPYLYVICRTTFVSRSRDVLDAAALLGSGPWRVFWKVALPMARPAIIAGLALIGMEVLNDYGTVKYYGVDTFTTGIFRAWFSMGDVSTGIRLSAILMFFVIAMLWMERGQRGTRAFVTRGGGHRPPERQRLGLWPTIWVVVLCVFVLMVSFILPLGQIIYWVSLTAHRVVDAAFWSLMVNSLLLALLSAMLIVVLATVLLYAARVNRIPWIQYASQLSILGYAIPGAVIAIGIYLPVVGLDKWLVQVFTGSGGLFLSLTVFMLVFAYTVRFMAVAYHSVSAGFQKVGAHISEASLMLGASTSRTLLRVDVPMIRNSLGAALMLVFVDVIKELPLTLILRPFNFHTLATRAFDLATNEQIAESANFSLCVVVIGLLPVILLNKVVKGNRDG